MKKKKLAKIKYTAYVAVSIDGRMAKNKKSGTNWTSSEDWNFFQKSLTKMDAVVVGYNTYKVAESRLKKRNTVVLTSKVDKIKSSGSVFFINPKKNNLKKFLSTKNYERVAVLGGSRVYNFCLENKMLDELFITIEPYVFTTGIQMFSGVKFKKYKFLLESVKRLNKSGSILLKYKNAN